MPCSDAGVSGRRSAAGSAHYSAHSPLYACAKQGLPACMTGGLEDHGLTVSASKYSPPYVCITSGRIASPASLSQLGLGAGEASIDQGWPPPLSPLSRILHVGLT